MRIGLIAPPWVAVPPKGYGGIEAFLDVLARGLSAGGHEVVLFASADSTCPVPTVSLLDAANGLGVAGTAVEAAHVLHAYENIGDFDLVHDHTVIGPLLGGRYASRPVVTTNHGPFSWPFSDVYAALAGRVPIIAISHHQATTADPIPITAVIHHGFDPAAFPVGDGRGGYALFLGRMSADKGVETAALAARRAGVKLLIAAKMDEATEHEYFAARIKPLLGEDVEYIGEVRGAEKLSLLGGARCLLNPIAWPEPFGLAMIESLACGTPVIATPEGSVPEIVDNGRTGMLCPDTDALVCALQRVGGLSRSECRAVFEERFSADRMVADHIALYERVVAHQDSDPFLPPPATSRRLDSSRRYLPSEVGSGEGFSRAT